MTSKNMQRRARNTDYPSKAGPFKMCHWIVTAWRQNAEVGGGFENARRERWKQAMVTGADKNVKAEAEVAFLSSFSIPLARFAWHRIDSLRALITSYCASANSSYNTANYKKPSLLRMLKRDEFSFFRANERHRGRSKFCLWTRPAADDHCDW